MSFLVRILFFFAIALPLTIVGGFAWIALGVFYFGPDCEAQQLERLPIPGTRWVAEMWMTTCGFGLSSPLEIRAVNQTTKETVKVATIDDGGETTWSANDAELVITLPNLIDMWDTRTSFDGVKVTYRFEPYDDPYARSMYQRYLRNKEDGEAKQWYCKDFIGAMDDPNRKKWAAIDNCPQ